MSRILFIGPDYYAYADRIAQEMRAQGHTVTRFPIEPHGALNKGLRRYAPALHARSLDRHHREIFARIGDARFDQVVFLQAHQYSLENLAALRSTQQDARFILYNWDSTHTHDYRPQLRFFDKAATFDPIDADALGIDYLPLFALPEFYRVAAIRATPRHDIYFVGSVHSQARFEAVRRLYQYCQAEGLRLKLHLHCSPPRMARLLRQGQWLPGMTLRSIDIDGIVEMMRTSTAVFDFASMQQNGLTMRIFENLAAGMKIIATNPQIAREPFFSPDRILLLDQLDFTPVKPFLAAPLERARTFEEYSLSNWLRRLLG